MTLLR